MSKTRRQWKAAEKLEIIQDSDLLGASVASRKHGVATSMINRWKKRFEEQGIEGLQRSSNHNGDQEKHQLIREIERLRQVVADQALTIRIKDELLKKTRYR